MMRCFRRRGLQLSTILLFGCCLTVNGQAEDVTKTAAAQQEPKKTADAGQSLFDGKTLKGWKITNFGGQGDVVVKDGAMILEVGSDLTGVHTTRKLPRQNYEITLEAKRVDGSDFFCGLTFPVGKERCSLIVGGWGGGVCGLSTIDGLDASENDTTSYRMFKNGQWYKFRLRVTEANISAWIDGKQFVDQDIRGKKVSIRGEVDASKPLGFSSWQTTAALRNIRIRPLKPAELKKAQSETLDQAR